VTGKM